MGKKNAVKKMKENKVQIPREEYIQMLSMRSNAINATNHNSKTGQKCLNVQFPKATCREDVPCAKDKICYCERGCQQMCTVQAAYLRNYRIYNEDPTDFWNQVRMEIKRHKLPLFRWNDSGDMPDEFFVDGIVQIAKEFPDVKFLIYTKKYYYVNEWREKGNVEPDNLTIRFSYWDKTWVVNNPFDYPPAYIDFKDKSMNVELPERGVRCPNLRDKSITCSDCRACWNKKLKIVFDQH